MKKSRKNLLTLFFLLTTCVSVVIFFHFFYKDNNYIVNISHESGIYSDAFELTVNANQKGICYYTIDGSTPSPEGANTYTYTEPLWLSPIDETTVYSLQFVYIFNDGTQSDVISRDYILDENAPSRYTTQYVISVTGNEYDLFSYENGLFTRGQVFDDYLAQYPDADLLSTVIPANYYSNAEIPVHIAIFSPDGNNLLTQNCGLKIYGNVTRAKNQKSFRLIARYDYDIKNEFTYSFFPNLYSDVTNVPITNFQRLSLHNSGNDNYYAFMRNALIGELARQSGFPDVLVSESATVYVNGKYQGVYWLQNTFDDRYFKEKYGNYNGEMIVCEGTLNRMNESLSDTVADASCATDYNNFVNTVSNADISLESTWKYVCDTLDISNFAQYMAIEYYINNIDWPTNNVKVYRYLAAEGEPYQENTVFDGKYRFLLFDTDYGLGLKFLGSFGYDAYEKRLANFLSEGNSTTVLFQKLMERDEFRELFINNVVTLLSQSFSCENIETQMHDFNGKRYGELEFMTTQTQLMNGDLWEEEPLTMEQVWEEMNDIVKFAKKRPSIVLSELQEVLQCGNGIPLSIQSSDESSFVLNCMDVGTAYEGLCLQNIPITLTCNTINGKTVAGYYVNDTYINGSTLTLLPNDYDDNVDSILITPDIISTDIECLIIDAYQTDGAQDYVIIKNNGTLPVQLANYAISDNESDPGKSRLPRYTLYSEETFYVYGKGFTLNTQEPSCRVPFSWNSEEHVILFNSLEQIIDSK